MTSFKFNFTIDDSGVPVAKPSIGASMEVDSAAKSTTDTIGPGCNVLRDWLDEARALVSQADQRFEAGGRDEAGSANMVTPASQPVSQSPPGKIKQSTSGTEDKKKSPPTWRVERVLGDETDANDRGLYRICHLDDDEARAQLVSGKYEGGFKLWECALDLCNKLRHEQARFAPLVGRVLELGCGHGLPGIWCAVAAQTVVSGGSNGNDDNTGAADYRPTVVLQDYNEAVLRRATAPNVLRNGVQPESVRLVAGDWSSMLEAYRSLVQPTQLAGRPPAALAMSADHLFGAGPGSPSPEMGGAQPALFDLILSAETLYNSATLPSLLSLTAHALRWPAGRALFASKTYYFGVGGGIKDLLVLLEGSEDGKPPAGRRLTPAEQAARPDSAAQPLESDRLVVHSRQVVQDGQVKREIIELKWKRGAM